MEEAKLDMKMPYVRVSGEKGITFLQGGNVFDGKGNLLQKDVVGKSPDEISRFAILNEQQQKPKEPKQVRPDIVCEQCGKIFKIKKKFRNHMAGHKRSAKLTSGVIKENELRSDTKPDTDN